MASRPQTLYGIADSPVGLAAWLLDHNDADGQPAAAVAAALTRPTSASGELTRDEVLDNITLYWLTNTGVSASRLYWEYQGGFFNAKGVSIPVAVSVFPGEQYQAPRSWATQAYPEPHLLQRGRQRRPLRRLGAAAAVLRRGSRRLPADSVTPMFRHRNEYRSEGRLPGFEGATAWVNGGPLAAADLRGRVVLVCFGTYTCINWIHTLPYVRAWADRYGPQGLIVVGVQTPEFEFESDLGNVTRALGELDVGYPVVVDNDYAVWRAFDNHYWPALYFADSEGQIRHHHFGEGGYEESEMVVRMLLQESGADIDESPVRPEPAGVEAPADWDNLGTPETYVGYDRVIGFASAGGVVPDVSHLYSTQRSLRRNEWALAGRWQIGGVPALLTEAGGRIVFQFHARDLHLVMGPPVGHPPVRYRVRLDGQPPGAAQGVDVDGNGDGSADYQRMYQLIRQPGPIDDRRFEIEFLDPTVEAFVFTFG